MSFIDAAKHWNGRGGGAQRPLGFDILTTTGATAPPFAIPASPDAEWPKLAKGQRAEGYEWKGYTPPKKGQPKYPYETMKELRQHAEKNNLSIAQVILSNEIAVSGKTEEQINAFLDKIANAMGAISRSAGRRNESRP